MTIGKALDRHAIGAIRYVLTLALTVMFLSVGMAASAQISTSETGPGVYPGDAPRGRMIAFILQQEEAAPREHEFREALDKSLPAEFGKTSDFVVGSNKELEAEATQIMERTRQSFPIVEGGQPLLFRVFDVPILIVPAARPLPRAEFAADWQPRRQFPSAPEVLEQHQAHTIIFALNDPKTTAEQVRAAEAVSVVATAFASGANTLGIHWGEADLAIPPAAMVEAFQKAKSDAEAAKAANQPVKPIWHRLLTMWVNIRPVTADVFRAACGQTLPEKLGTDIPDDAVGFATRGLAGFIGREIELIPSGRPAPEQALVLVNLLAYLLDQGQVFKDDDTLGFTEERTIVANIVEASKLPGMGDTPILRLSYMVEGEAAEAASEPPAN